MPESEEALLRRAAQTVRETAAPANDIDWRVAVDTEGQLVMGAGGSEVAKCRDPYDAAWIALVGRQLAEPLAAWLDEAVEYEQQCGFVDAAARDVGDSSRWDYAARDAPLAVARALLGEPALTAPVGDDREEKK